MLTSLNTATPNIDLNTVLVTGGAGGFILARFNIVGYIGSHICLLLLQSKYHVVIFDNFSNSNSSIIDSIRHVAGNESSLSCVTGDICNENDLHELFLAYPSIKSVIHLAGLKSVTESETNPYLYYKNNVQGFMNLLNCIEKYSQIDAIIFSSSAAVYGDTLNTTSTINEETACTPKSFYGKTKLMGERLLHEFSYRNENTKKIRSICFRYFNPVGAHPSGLLGEVSKQSPTNLMPVLARVAIGQLPFIEIFGTDYDTIDGSGCRDFIHVMDVSNAHVLALLKLTNHTPNQKYLSNDSFTIYNVGCEKGYTVYQMHQMMEKVTQKKIPLKKCSPRRGDIGSIVADCSKIQNELGWKAKYNLEEMCVDIWRFYCASNIK